MNGKELKVDDTILIPCKVKSITLESDYCNVTVETNEFMPPYTTPTTITLNSRQVLKKE